MPNSSPVTPPPVYAQPWAVKLGAALIVALTLIVGLAFFDNSHRTELETTSETTAIGDTHFFQPPADVTRMPAVGATLNGQPLYVADLNPVEVRDTHTHRIGTDSSRGLAVYKLATTATSAEVQRVGSKPRAYLLKAGASQFVIARPAETP